MRAAKPGVSATRDSDLATGCEMTTSRSLLPKIMSPRHGCFVIGRPALTLTANRSLQWGSLLVPLRSVVMPVFGAFFGASYHWTLVVALNVPVYLPCQCLRSFSVSVSYRYIASHSLRTARDATIRARAMLRTVMPGAADEGEGGLSSALSGGGPK